MAINYHYDVTQNADEWHDLRLGVITASNINKILTATGKPAKNQAMRDYAADLAAQRLFKRKEDAFQSFQMLMGHLKEDVAREIYSDNFAPVEECGFITNDNYDFQIGASPDGLIGDDGGIEIKSRMAKFQMQTIIDGEVPKEFINQIQASLLVSGRDWWDFISYSPGLPFFVKRVKPDMVRREAIIEAITEFEAEVNRVMSEYQEKASSLVPTEWVDFGVDGEITGSD